MDEKRESRVPETRLKQSSRSRTIGFLFLTLALWFFTFRFSVHLPWSPPCKGREHAFPGITYVGEQGLRWERCGDIDGRMLECSTMNVPMDHFDSKNSDGRTFSIPLIRLRGSDDAKNILLNPGGPGGSGIGFMYSKGHQIGTIVGKGHHLVSFDPRGVNGSRPQANCYPDEETRKALSNVRLSRPVEDSVEAYAWTSGYVQACMDTLGEHGKYINTPQTAADMNSILDALGQKHMIYWGFSYGTILGQTYASMFPERSHRVIIDGVANNFKWFNETIVFDDSLVDTEKVLFGFFDECIKAGDRCPLASFAKTPERLQNKVLNLVDSLAENLPVYVNKTNWGLLNQRSLFITGLFPATYKPSSWWVVADRIARLLEGNATEAFLAWGGKGPWDHIITDDSNTVIHANDGATGPKFWPNGRLELLDYIAPFLNSSLFAWSESKTIYAHQNWAVPKTHEFKQTYDIETAHPLLILSTTYDPVCPLVAAKSARSAFEGSQIVEVQGYGHCALNLPSNCVAKHVRAYLYNGTVPEHHTTCEADFTYFEKPNENKTTISVQRFDNSEDQAIYDAQISIAQDNDWPYRW